MEKEELKEETLDQQNLTENEVISSDEAEINKGNPIANYFRLLFRDIRVHFKEKPGSIFGILVMITGILIGFTINIFINAAHGMKTEGLANIGGLLIFIIEVTGALNIVNAFGIMTSRRLKASIFSTLITAIICVCGALWISIATTKMAPNNKFIPDANTSVVIIIICMATSVIGSVGSFFFYDHDYKKETR